jgi:hypothetical protein
LNLLLDITEENLKTFSFFALAIKRVSSDQAHCALVYQRDSGDLYMLHLAFHHWLINNPISPDYQWVKAALTLSNRKLLAALCERIGARRPRIPYGFEKSGLTFDVKTGALSQPDLGHGLTCASFILAVMKAQGINLLAEDEWPAGANQGWQDNMLELMKENNAPQDHIEAVRKTVGGRRFRPEEVVGSATARPRPVSFGEANRLAEIVNRELHPVQAN